MAYCASRYRTVRRVTREVSVGRVAVGGTNPIRIQSMTTADTQDVEATVRESIALAEVGCEIVRVTAPNVAAAKCLQYIRQKFTEAGFGEVPLVADIHFLPSAAMEAVEHVEKVRVNPGNYADKKKFNIREYSDAQYSEELERLHDAFSPLVRRCRELGRSMRIGTNHGSLSDRIMNRYGDTPLGMVESALEFIRIAEANDFRDIILSMKASNPKVMIQAYRLLVERMDAENMPYPLHLGVTEAGDGEDGRIKSAIGIGSLLMDGLGDTIRVSLTEDSVYEIPVAQAIADKAMRLWDGKTASPAEPEMPGAIDPYRYERRAIDPVELSSNARIDVEQPPCVVVAGGSVVQDREALAARLDATADKLTDTPIEALVLTVAAGTRAGDVTAALSALYRKVDTVILELDGESVAPPDLPENNDYPRVGVAAKFGGEHRRELEAFLGDCQDRGFLPIIALQPEAVLTLATILRNAPSPWIATLADANQDRQAGQHALGAWRRLTDAMRSQYLSPPVWIRNTEGTATRHEASFLSRLLESSILSGALLCDGIGDLISVETESDPERSVLLAYNVLQGAGARISKTEFVACPSCGRTLFDLQSTTQRIREKTGHLKGVKIAIMGCIVNGPGEMADADFGYVGGAPGKINLYVGKECVRFNIPQAEADQRLIDLIKDHGKWVDPDLEPASTTV